VKYKFYVKDIPDPYPIWKWIQNNTNISKHIQYLKPSVDSSNLLTLTHGFNIPDIIDSTLDAVDKYGFKGWRSSLGEEKQYGGLSLTFNPEYAEDCDPNQQTLGTDKNLPTQFFYGQAQNFSTVRNTYFDSLGFRKLSPCVLNTGLKDIINGFKRSIIRSRIGIINSQYVSDEMRPRFLWHRDETVFENLRINVPIKTNETFMFEIEGQKPTHLKLGNLYSWDTNISHRVFPTTTEPSARIHLVFGFCPWFDYLPDDDAYVSNEFYGEVHPFDMLVNGHVHEKITGYSYE
jgi:hypothetical protein